MVRDGSLKSHLKNLFRIFYSLPVTSILSVDFAFFIIFHVIDCFLLNCFIFSLGKPTAKMNLQVAAPNFVALLAHPTSEALFKKKEYKIHKCRISGTFPDPIRDLY